jgi:hypothetical protein
MFLFYIVSAWNHGADWSSQNCGEGAGYYGSFWQRSHWLFRDKVLENQQLANVHNMNDNGIARLKTEIELREQKKSRFSLKNRADSMHKCHARH